MFRLSGVYVFLNFTFGLRGVFMNWKKIFNTIFFPHIAIIILFLPVAVAFLVFSLIYFTSNSTISIISYLFAFYMLLVICLRIPQMIKFFKKIKNENKYVARWFSDVRLRVNISLYGSLIWNGAYAIFQLGLGFYHNSVWFYSLAIYYLILAIMRFFLLKHTSLYEAGDEERKETKKYLLCGCLLLIMNVALAGILFLMIYRNQTFYHHQITTIALATYTFVTFTFAIINIVKYKKYNSDVYSASKMISLIASCVSMLTLESTMLTVFGSSDDVSFRQIMLGTTGTVVMMLSIAIAIFMIVRGSKKLKKLQKCL